VKSRKWPGLALHEGCGSAIGRLASRDAGKAAYRLAVTRQVPSWRWRRAFARAGNASGEPNTAGRAEHSAPRAMRPSFRPGRTRNIARTPAGRAAIDGERQPGRRRPRDLPTLPPPSSDNAAQGGPGAASGSVRVFGLLVLGLLAVQVSEANAVVCARGIYHAGCVGPNGAVGVRRPYGYAGAAVVRPAVGVRRLPRGRSRLPLMARESWTPASPRTARFFRTLPSRGGRHHRIPGPGTEGPLMRR
jgi:hypothetical protein